MPLLRLELPARPPAGRVRSLAPGPGPGSDNGRDHRIGTRPGRTGIAAGSATAGAAVDHWGPTTSYALPTTAAVVAFLIATVTVAPLSRTTLVP
ncbi:hypothetical protein ACIQWR_04450 [Streptomyces sp. NPDC098789]|uniref:hypothetical protein n=1 Tax=Streptomyces sp. NPDC098789 TaxID=3366098 RepID=UPI0037F78A73